MKRGCVEGGKGRVEGEVEFMKGAREGRSRGRGKGDIEKEQETKKGGNGCRMGKSRYVNLRKRRK